MSNARHWIGILAVLASEFALRDILLPEQPTDTYILSAVCVEWLFTGLLIVYWLPVVDGGTYRGIGITEFRWTYIWLGTAAFVTQLTLTLIVGVALEQAKFNTLRNVDAMLADFSYITRLGLFSVGTFVEEVLYRGYLIERVTFLTGNKWLGALVSWLSFTLVHVKFFGVGATLQVSILSASLVLTYLKDRSIWPCVVTHGINGVFAYLVLSAFARG